MGALDTIAKGALSQFGREFGRAAANSILNGQNSQKVELSDRYSGRLKQSDSSIVRAIKTIQKIDFVAQNKANASRLIEITDEFINVNKFNGLDTLVALNDFYALADIYNDKFAHGSALIEDGFEDKAIDHLSLKREELFASMKQFNEDCRSFISEQTSLYNQKKVIKSVFIIWAFPIWGFLGVHNFYANKPGKAIAHLLFCWTLILPLFNLFEFLGVLLMNQGDFDSKYNPELAFLSKFDVSNQLQK